MEERSAGLESVVTWWWWPLSLEAEAEEAEGEWLLARWKLEPGRSGGVGGKQTGTLAMAGS